MTQENEKDDQTAAHGASLSAPVGSALPWSERVAMLSIHPEAATPKDVAEMAAQLMEAAAGSRSDTERLEFLLRFLSVEDVGDEDFIPGVVVNPDALEEAIGVSGVLDWKEDLRTIIDRAINHSENVERREQQ